MLIICSPAAKEAGLLILQRLYLAGKSAYLDWLHPLPYIPFSNKTSEPKRNSRNQNYSVYTVIFTVLTFANESFKRSPMLFDGTCVRSLACFARKLACVL